jgi:4-diphosphocytidyl-2-C-methyl-D-erythritol kinase
VLLANPGPALATEAVYAELRAGALAAPRCHVTETLDFSGDFEKLIAYALPRGNDLEAPAAQLAPSIRGVLAALLSLKGVRMASLSGSGPTCFALFATAEEAKRATATLAAEHPDWWIAATTL